jgi:hypothetical protein
VNGESRPVSTTDSTWLRASSSSLFWLQLPNVRHLFDLQQSCFLMGQTYRQHTFPSIPMSSDSNMNKVRSPTTHTSKSQGADIIGALGNKRSLVPQ